MIGLLQSIGRLIRRRIGKGAALGSGFVLLAGTVAIASIPDSSGTIHGCYNNVNGLLRVIDLDTQICRTNETAIAWNQTGPQGPVGPQGPAGQQGPPGSSQRSLAYSVVIGTCGSGSATHFNLFGGISGTFNAPVLIPGGTGCVSGTGFRMALTWDFQNVNAVGAPLAVGGGTATCDPCTVAGRTGAVSFALTMLSTASTDASGAPQGPDQVGGTWTIVGATGELLGLSGQGTYGGQSPIVFTGTITLPT